MKDTRKVPQAILAEKTLPGSKVMGQVANEIYVNALTDAKAQLHPLIRETPLDKLRKRSEFVRALKLALEQQIAQKVAAWQPGVQAVFQFNESRIEGRNPWNGSIHLLVKVPRLSHQIKAFGKMLDQGLLKCLKQSGWARFQKRRSILEIQQVTPNELRHGVSYGAMFHAAYNVPVKIWPVTR